MKLVAEIMGSGSAMGPAELPEDIRVRRSCSSSNSFTTPVGDDGSQWLLSIDLDDDRGDEGGDTGEIGKPLLIYCGRRIAAAAWTWCLWEFSQAVKTDAAAESSVKCALEVWSSIARRCAVEESSIVGRI